MRREGCRDGDEANPMMARLRAISIMVKARMERGVRSAECGVSFIDGLEFDAGAAGEPVNVDDVGIVTELPGGVPAGPRVD